MWCIQGPVYIFVSMIITNYYCSTAITAIHHLQCYDLAKKSRSIRFWCQGEETGKEHLSDNCCWLWIIDHHDFDGKVCKHACWFTCMCESLYVHWVLFVCILQGHCSLTALKVSGCRTPFPISRRSPREATFTPPLAKSTARLLSAWPTSMNSSSI